MNFSKELISWYEKGHRDLPWRDTRDPYKVWLSEIILQQTRVDQGMNYYLKFCSEFPKIEDLASADEDQVMKLWQGLGYYSRARNLHKAAKYVTEQFNGKFPESYQDLLKLPGVGPYTAAAIASFSFREKVAVVDGNVYRVLSRVFGIDDPIDTPQGQKKFKNLAQELIDHEKPDIYNQAIMELGATCCKPKQPNCLNCVFKRICIAQKEQTIQELPKKARKTKIKELYIYYAVQKDESGNLLIRQRLNMGIWEKLYDFPGIESEIALNDSTAIDRLSKEYELKDMEIEGKFGPYSHILSHRKIQAYFYLIQPIRLSSFSNELLVVAEEDYQNYAIPRLIEKFWNDLENGGSATLF